ncbi:MAG: thiolase family protein [Nitrospinota bacterium]|jgi:acetyl-CoA acetyltransferase|nr:thiolase family protein [Nitrospinota bacterium]HJM43455.1 thiolase family protein [Nitrospinota bacterium]
MKNGFPGSCAIAGIGETDVGKLPDRTSLSLHIEAAAAAIRDAGLSKADIDGVLSMPPYDDPAFMFCIQVAEGLGLHSRFSSDLNLGGATPVVMVLHAAAAIAAGLAETVVCTCGEARLSGRGRPKHGRRSWGYENFENPFGRIGPVSNYAMAARRHMHEYGTTSAQFGAVAVAMRTHALLNEGAQMKKPMTIEDHQNSRFIAEPFRLFDCCLNSDGAAAVVVTTTERAGDLPHAPALILGGTQCHTHKNFFEAPSPPQRGEEDAARDLQRKYGLSAGDFDFAELYDCFTFTVLAQLESYGFCKAGEGGPFAEAGSIDLGKTIPVNTHGGLLSHGYIDGMTHITEAAKQLRGGCGTRQVEGAELGLVTGNGGDLATHANLVLRRG